MGDIGVVFYVVIFNFIFEREMVFVLWINRVDYGVFNLR